MADKKIALREALIAQWLSRLPWRIRLALSIVAIGAGIYVITRPTMSLDLLATLIGIGAIIEGALAPFVTQASVRWRIATAGAWITVGIVVLWAPWLTVLALTILVGVGLIGIGVYRIVVAIKTAQTLDEKIAAIALGAAAVAFGLVAFFWRDISLVVLSVVFGAWLVIAGVNAGWRSLPIVKSAAGERRKTGWRRFAHSIVAIVTASAAVLAVGATVIYTRGDTITDTFYAAPRDLPAEPGRLISVEPFTRGVPANAVGFRYLYSTLATNGTMQVASAIAITPNDGKVHPSITWAHSTTGLAQQCAPSLATDAFRYGGMFASRQIIDRGWALVMPDYVGLGTHGEHPYLIGEDTGRSVLDATRAAYSIIELRISRTTVLWGHSQGGHSALWASQIATQYAPELNVRGTAAISPVSDLTALVSTLNDVTGGMVFVSFVLAAYAKHYSDVTPSDYLRPGMEVSARTIPQNCLTGPGSWMSAVAVAARLADPAIFRVDPRSGALGVRLRQNTPTPSSETPLLITAGTDDPLVAIRVQDGYVSQLCKSGIPVKYDKVEGADHISMLYGNAPYLRNLLDWTSNRIAKIPTTHGCS